MKLHDRELRRRLDIPFVGDGWPDIGIFVRRGNEKTAFFFEFKFGKDRLKENQLRAISLLGAIGFPTFIIHADNHEDGMSRLKEILKDLIRDGAEVSEVPMNSSRIYKSPTTKEAALFCYAMPGRPLMENHEVDHCFNDGAE